MVGRAQQPRGPVIVVETTKGAFEFETYPNDAPKTVAHIVDLVKRGFYDGQRVHRAIPGFVIQWGDPQSRDAAQTSRLGARRGRVERHADRRGGIREEAGPRDRRGRPRSRRQPGARRQPDLRDAGGQARTERQIRGLRPCGFRGGRPRTNPAWRRDREDVRQGMMSARLTMPASGGKRVRSCSEYSPSTGSPSCSLIIAALATDFAEK